MWLLVLALVAALPCASAADTARTVANAQELGVALSDQQVTTINIKGAAGPLWMLDSNACHDGAPRSWN